jgi:hypothetical protein
MRIRHSAKEFIVDNERTCQLIRTWLADRREHPEPPPPPAQIRRIVGWAEEGSVQDRMGQPDITLMPFGS